MGTQAALSRDDVAAVRAALADGMTTAAAAERFGLPPDTITAIRRGKKTGRDIPPADRAERWIAACLEPDEWEAWQRANRTLNQSSQASRPCDDCTLGFAADMRALGRCNGQPGGIAPDHDTDHEEDPMEATITTLAEKQPTAKARITIAAPCRDCTHAPVCRLRDAVIDAASLSVPVPVLGDGIAINLTGTVECDWFTKAKGSGMPRVVTKPRTWTDEQRAAQAERMRSVSAAKVAARASGE